MSSPWGDTDWDSIFEETRKRETEERVASLEMRVAELEAIISKLGGDV